MFCYSSLRGATVHRRCITVKDMRKSARVNNTTVRAPNYQLPLQKWLATIK